MYSYNLCTMYDCVTQSEFLYGFSTVTFDSWMLQCFLLPAASIVLLRKVEVYLAFAEIVLEDRPHLLFTETIESSSADTKAEDFWK